MQKNLSDDSRVWIYQSNRLLTIDEASAIQKHVDQFCEQWTSHSNQLKAAGQVVNRSFIVLMADESQSGASGCSIDTSVHFIKTLQQQYGIDLFDRMNFAYEGDDGIQIANKSTFEQLYQSGGINDQTPVFDTLVKTKKDFDTSFKKALADSWHHRFV